MKKKFFRFEVLYIFSEYIYNLNALLNRVLSFLSHPNSLLFMINKLSVEKVFVFFSLFSLQQEEKKSRISLPKYIEAWEPQINFIIGHKVMTVI